MTWISVNALKRRIFAAKGEIEADLMFKKGRVLSDMGLADLKKFEIVPLFV